MTPPQPGPATLEGQLQRRTATWGITTEKPHGRTRTDTRPDMFYFPLDQHLLDGVDALLHVSAARPVMR